MVEKLFELDKDIRWVGIVDQQGHIVQNVQRPGVESLTDKTTDELTLHVFPTIMRLLWGRLIGEIRKLNSLVVACSQVYLLAFYVEDFLIVLTFEPRGMPSVVRKLEVVYGTLFPKSSNSHAKTI